MLSKFFMLYLLFLSPLTFFAHTSNQSNGSITTFDNTSDDSIITINTKKPLHISLGIGCTTALMLNQLNLREKSYPFDWVISKNDALINALNDDFKHYFTNLTVYKDNDSVVDYYGFRFPHVNLQSIHNTGFNFELTYKNNDFIFESWHKYIPAAREAFKRRLDLFRNACLGDQKVYFIRSTANSTQGPITKRQAIILRDTIRTNYPNLDFCLIIISSSNYLKTPWNLDNIKNYYGYPLSDLLWKRLWENLLKDAENSIDFP